MAALPVGWGGGGHPRLQGVSSVVCLAPNGVKNAGRFLRRHSPPVTTGPAPEQPVQPKPQQPCHPATAAQHPQHAWEEAAKRLEGPRFEDNLEDLADVDDTPLMASARPTSFSFINNQLEEQSRQSATPVSSFADRTASGLASNRPTELIFRLERRGQGWGEEILPHLVVEHRVIEPNRPGPKKGKPGSRPEAWEDGSVEQGLASLPGMDREKVDELVGKMSTWRITSRGRRLIDRRRRFRLQRNLVSVLEQLKNESDMSEEDTKEMLVRWPHLLLCKPSTDDRFDRRVISLAVFKYRNGHLRVPEDYKESPELHKWVKRVRMSHGEGGLNEERREILDALGFEFGEVAQRTDDWETHFDQLMDWQHWLHVHAETDAGRPNAARGEAEVPGHLTCGLDWGEKGGPAARECALWVQLQRELRNRGIMEEETEKRLNATHMVWTPQDVSRDDHHFMTMLGRVLLAAEQERCRHPEDVAAMAAALEERDRHPTFTSLIMGHPIQSMPLETISDLLDLGRRLCKSRAPTAEIRGPGRPVANRTTAFGVIAPDKLAKERRAALYMSQQLEPGLGYWLAKQRRLWRMGRLSYEKVALMQQAGVDFDVSGADEWLAYAHTTVKFVSGQNPALSPLAPWPTSRDQQITNSRQRVVPGGKPLEYVVMAPPLGAPGQPTPVAVRRWVLTQKALFESGQLAPVKLRYLNMLGITWLLSDLVVHMKPATWATQYEALAFTALPPARATVPPTAALREWLSHQKGLFLLGMLTKHRVALLDRLGIHWRPALTESESRWTVCFAHLVAFVRCYNHSHVPRSEEQLWYWLEHQKSLWRAGRLPASRQASLLALMVEPHASSAMPGPPGPLLANAQNAASGARARAAPAQRPDPRQAPQISRPRSMLGNWAPEPSS
mmetsp:Transcript_6443/g.18579  ORF Transcript_6443/g.18579 Transcript_6443/m.18579 type:complete len:900 (-) Transcript_6443:636-3335(-)|eukprot:CAMPEP_0206140494 /NCGR_PEP_ID=MMETSP1473-20131121/9599_1 /ASSEMBLY_ACC=CAM_ASM_001109 /TAXON_ID=1461547 /ORGANISM="Stichococcus sp, Strain RCC1054" /LENGTH=899 /DNA_ID=CAMNT_0053534653 /DNA_START=216 /DNA_END=2915 /DNA_ORIENTATION=+